MGNIIRNYNDGSRVLLSEWTRQHGARELETSPEEKLRRAAEQVHRDAEALRLQTGTLLADAQNQAQAILDAAQEEAIMLQATAQAAGYETGYAQGLADGQKKGEAALTAAVARVEDILVQLTGQRDVVMGLAELEVVHLTVALVEKIIGQISQSQEELILHTVTRALTQLAATGPFRLRVHPDDRTFLLRHWQTDPTLAPSEAWELVADPSVERGGCLLVCGPTTIDARLSTQMRTLVNALQLVDSE